MALSQSLLATLLLGATALQPPARPTIKTRLHANAATNDAADVVVVTHAAGRMGASLCGNQSSSALQFVVSRGLREVLLAQLGRLYQRDVVSEFGPKTWPRCRDSETRPLSRGKKRGTRRIDGVEGPTTLSGAGAEGLDDALRRRRREDNTG